MLSPLPPIHSLYFTLGNGWTNNFLNTKNLAMKLGLTVPLDPNKEPVAPLGTCFWFRTKALQDLLKIDWKYKDFPPEPNAIDGTILHAIERIYPFCAQSQGYYVGYLLPDTLASMKLNQLSFYRNEFVNYTNNVHVYGSPYSVFDQLKNKAYQPLPAVPQMTVPGNTQPAFERPPYGVREALKIYLNKKLIRFVSIFGMLFYPLEY